jgi:hypothetical protein
MVALILVYLAIAYAIHLVRCYYHDSFQYCAQHAKRLFDGAVFSGSALVLVGIYYPPLLTLIGDTTIYLAIAALAGLGYSARALWPRFPRRHTDDD